MQKSSADPLVLASLIASFSFSLCNPGKMSLQALEIWMPREHLFLCHGASVYLVLVYTKLSIVCARTEGQRLKANIILLAFLLVGSTPHVVTCLLVSCYMYKRWDEHDH